MKLALMSGLTEMLADEGVQTRVVTLAKDQHEGLGFSIRGGSEHGLGIFVSDVDHNSAAGKAQKTFICLEVLFMADTSCA